MKKYQVFLYLSVSKEIEAESQEQAEEEAINILPEWIWNDLTLDEVTTEEIK